MAVQQGCGDEPGDVSQACHVSAGAIFGRGGDAVRRSHFQCCRHYRILALPTRTAHSIKASICSATVSARAADFSALVLNSPGMMTSSLPRPTADSGGLG